ncbi:MAG: hypothetical protein KGL38_08205, partial [Gemmatimonadota bacterium]|nr:hypothetical protein [Gemmatimonadota bacterium]
SAVDVLRSDGRVADGAGIAVVAADGLTALPALVTAPADPVRLGAANRALQQAGIPWRFGPARRGAAAVTGEGMPRVEATLRSALEPAGPAASDTLARVGSEPWIVAGPGWVLVASPLVPDATTLPVSAAFVPWVAGVLADRLSGDPGRVVAAAPIQELSWPAWADAVDGAAGAPGAAFRAPARPGTYFFTRAGRRVGALVVNPEPRESDLARWPATGFARLLGPRARVFTDDDAFARALFDVGAPRPLAVPLLVALLAVLAVEGTIAARQAGADR